MFLKENGGYMDINCDYVCLLMRRMNFVKRKGVKIVCKLFDDFEKIKGDFLDNILKCVKENNILYEFIINFD